MKPLVNAAVLGLLPTPLMLNMRVLVDKEDPPGWEDEVRVGSDPPEQLAAEEELARLRRGVGTSVEQRGQADDDA